VRSLALEPEGDEMRSAFYTPVPTTGNPTEVLANRFLGESKSFLALLRASAHILTLNYNSMAQSIKRSYYLFPRNPEPIRTKVKNPLESLQRYQ
jgi:hypothetical protein